MHHRLRRKKLETRQKKEKVQQLVQIGMRRIIEGGSKGKVATHRDSPNAPTTQALLTAQPSVYRVLGARPNERPHERPCWWHLFDCMVGQAINVPQPTARHTQSNVS